MASYNDITGNCLVTRPATDAYRNNFDAIFGKKDVPAQPQEAPETTPEEDAAWLELAKKARQEGFSSEADTASLVDRIKDK